MKITEIACIAFGLIILSWCCAGELVCYSRYLQDHYTVKVNRTLCDDNYGNIYETFRSEQEVSFGELLDSAFKFVTGTDLPSSTMDPDCRDWSTPEPGSYVFSKRKMNWFDAATACKDYGETAHLAFIERESEKKFILNFIDEELRDVNCTVNRYTCNVWIGLNDLQEEGVWKWYNKTVQIFEGQIFQESGGDTEHCGRIIETVSGVWADADCWGWFYSICEI